MSSPEQRQQQQFAQYADTDLGLERSNSHESNDSSNFTHRGFAPRGKSTNSLHSSQPDITASPSPSSTRLVNANYSRPRLEHAHTQPYGTVHSQSSPRSFFTPDVHSQSFSGPSSHGISSSFDEDELRQIMSRSPDTDNTPAMDGHVGQGVKSANHQDISPFLFQNESATPSASSSSRSPRTTANTSAVSASSPAPPAASRSRTRRGTATHQYTTFDTSFGSLDQPGLSSSRSQYSLRPQTPPSASTSTSTLNGSKDTHASAAKKSRNPFGFLKKKPSAHSNASAAHPTRHDLGSVSSLSSRYGSNAANLNPMRPPAWLDNNRTLASSTSPSSASLRSHYHQPAAASASTAWHNSLASRMESLPAAMSLEDELEAEHQPKKDPPQTHQRSQSQSIEQEVELSLDMNFDQLEDFVDTNAARQRLQGSVAESASPSEHRSPSGSEAATYRSPSPSQASLTDRQASVASTVESPSHASESSLAPSGSLRTPSRTTAATSTSSASTVLSDRRPSQINMLPRNSVPRLSLAEMQNYQSLRKLSTNLIDMPQLSVNGPGSGPSSAALLRRGSVAVPHAAPEASSQLGVASMADAILGDHRKDSVASAHSMQSNHSGISPKTSYANLPGAIQERQKPAAALPAGAGWTAAPTKDAPANGRANHSYQFPPAADHPASSLLSVRKSSAGSGQEASSSWMAPDSWAVQPDKMHDYLRDDNVGEEEDDDDHQHQAIASDGKRRGSSSGVSSTHAASMFRTSSNDPFKKAASLTGSRRGTEESVDPLTVLPPPPGSKSVDEAAANKVDVLQQTNNLAQSALAQQQSQTHNHQLGSAHALPAAAAAAGKLGLHRPSKHRMNARPNTAGSIGATRPSTATIGSSLSAEDDSSVNGSVRRDGHPLKRSTTANANNAPGSSLRNHFIRVYKTDGTFATLSCSLASTATEVQTILARKSLTSESASYRLFVRDKGSERPLGISDKPSQLQRRRLLQAGHTENDGLEDMGRDDLSYLLRFVFRPDSVPTFDSESIGHSEHTFQHLDLHSRNLEMVPIFLYKHADWIVSLDLSGNPMSDLPLDFVQLCSSLRTLRLSNLALKRIPQSVRHSETLTHLDVSNNRLVELSHIALDLIPELMSLKVQNNRLFDLPPYFDSIRTLRNLNISNNRFDEFPSVICEMPSLVDLDVSFNSITELPAEIAKLVNLERFILAGNELEKLPDSMSELISLRTIDLRRNKVQDVSSLLGLPRLQNIQAESNNIKSFEATLGPQLTQVELGRNPLSKVRIAALTTCDLTSLDLSSTNMTRLEEGLFPQLPALVKLTLDGNQLVVLPDTLGDLKRLEMLSCSNNLLATLPESIGALKALKELLVHNNNLKTLPQSLWLCQSLVHINLSSNLLESFPTAPDVRNDASLGDIAAAAGASTIIAARKGSTSSSLTHRSNAGGSNGANNLSTPSEVFVAPLSLSLPEVASWRQSPWGRGLHRAVRAHLHSRVLNLSFNEIFEIPDFSLQTLTKLRELYVSGNQLSTIPSDDLVVLQELRILHLNCNKLTTLPTELGKLKKLANLDVGNNNPELRYASLSGNTRLKIKTKLSDMGLHAPSNISDF
ncbi:putative Adenylate cyclase (putative), partial [Pseudozyma hubeiensis]